MSWPVVIRQVLIVASAAMICWGLTLPVLGVAIFRDKTLLDLSPTGAYILAGLAGGSVLLAVLRKWWGLYITGTLALGLLLYTVYAIQDRKSEVERDIREHVADSPFTGALRGVVQGAHLRSGFYVMSVGAVALVAVPLLWGRIRFGQSQSKDRPVSC